ncbi:hypothetical protein [Sulfurovum sp.]|uniref:hypothetical protein n=1 Tax=Sulfurovum sp. TaxID=1969726 RepID=UPI002867FC7E|nr:hypothetical protein [Sulfurovum sp.]
MTQKELIREIKRIDGFIEVLQGFLKNPVCACISSVNNTDKKFTQENKEHLQLLIKIKNYLLPLLSASDDTLAEVDYRPVVFTC